MKTLKFESGLFAWQIQSLRQKQNLSLQDLATIVQIHSQMLWRIEHETSEPRARDFIQLCAWLGKSPSEFFTVVPKNEIQAKASDEK